MEITLTPEDEQRIERLIQSGRYQTPFEVIAAALLLMNESDKGEESTRQEIRRKIQEGIDSLDRGEGIPVEEAYQRLLQRSIDHRRNLKK